MAHDSQNITLKALISKAAELRVQGQSWEKVAEVVSRSAGTVRRWQYDFTEEWNEALLAAIDNALPTYEHEALLTLRMAMRDGKEAQKIRAARALLQHSRELRGIKHEIQHKAVDTIRFEVEHINEGNGSG